MYGRVNRYIVAQIATQWFVGCSAELLGGRECTVIGLNWIATCKCFAEDIARDLEWPVGWITASCVHAMESMRVSLMESIKIVSEKSRASWSWAALKQLLQRRDFEFDRRGLLAIRDGFGQALFHFRLFKDEETRSVCLAFCVWTHDSWLSSRFLYPYPVHQLLGGNSQTVLPNFSQTGPKFMPQLQWPPQKIKQ